MNFFRKTALKWTLF